MKKTKYYRYLGRNGSITSVVLLEQVTPIQMYELRASQGKVLTNGEETAAVKMVFLDELEDWYEIDDQSVKSN